MWTVTVWIWSYYWFPLCQHFNTSVCCILYECCCRILPCLREATTVQQAVMNPAKNRTTRFLTVVTATSTRFILKSTRTSAPSRPHVAVRCHELRCQGRRANDDYGPALKSYTTLIIITFQACLVNSCIDNVSVRPLRLIAASLSCISAAFSCTCCHGFLFLVSWS